MEDLRRFTRFGQKQAGVHNKFYEVEAQEQEDGRAEWIFRWGRIGTRGQEKRGTVYDFDCAKRKCIEQFRAKEKRGYAEANAMEALATAVQTLEERPKRGLEAVEIEVPCFHAGASEKRCKALCEKYLAKLNVVRRSKFDLDEDRPRSYDTEYDLQITQLLKSFCKEWKRICGTKTHGHLADNANAHTAFRIFFGALKRDAGCQVYGYFEGVGTSY